MPGFHLSGQKLFSSKSTITSQWAILIISTVTFLLVSNLNDTVQAANILMIHPLAYKSHYNAFRPLANALVKRGHRVTSMNYFPVNNDNYTANDDYIEIDLTGCLLADNNDEAGSDLEESFTGSRTIPDKAASMYSSMQDELKIIANCGKIFQQTFALHHSQPFDLVMIEIFYNEAYLGFAWKFQVPIIVLYANRLPPWLGESMATVDNPSYVCYTHNPWLFDFRQPKFAERAYNAFAYLYTQLAFIEWFRPMADDIVENHFGPDVPPIRDIEANVSLVLSYANTFTNGPKSNFPNIIEVGGLNIEEKPSALPKDIERFIDESSDGVIYFSMGSLLNPDSLPVQKREAFLYAFSKVPQRILWKWNGEVPRKMKNIYASKWLPQRDILAHPKIKLFITHGGALGVNEAIFEAVPILGIPIYGDQNINVQNMVANGVAEYLDYSDISNSTVLEKIRSMLNNPRYKENMKRLSATYKDRPMSPLDTAVYWSEYVIRHKGAHHLRSPAIHLSWYQYLLLDVIGFVSIVTFVTLYVFYSFLRFVIIKLIFVTNKKNVHRKPKKKRA